MLLAKLENMTREEIEGSFEISGKEGTEGTTFLAEGGGEKYAVKLFKKKKSGQKILDEAELQSMAADFGVAPAVHYVSTTQNFIVMDALEETVVNKGKRENWTGLPEEYAAQLYALCKRLDDAGVVQNDGNPLNLMLDANGRMYIIDYGLAIEITPKIEKKRGPQPNVGLTLWDFARRLPFYKIKNDLRKKIYDKYMNDNSFVDQVLLDKGERLLGPIGAPPTKKKPTPKKPRKKKPTPKKPRKKKPSQYHQHVKKDTTIEEKEMMTRIEARKNHQIKKKEIKRNRPLQKPPTEDGCSIM